MVKVFLYVTSLAIGGAERQCCRLAVALKRNCGYDVAIVVTYANRSNVHLLDSLTEAKIPVYECCWKSPMGLWRMYKLFKDSGPDSSLFCYCAFPDFFGGLIGSLAGLKKKYGGVRGEELPWLNRIMDRIAQRWLLKALIFNSFRGRERFLAGGFLAEKALVISNAIPPTEYVHGQETNNGGLTTVIAVGVFKWEKDYKTWIETFASVNRANPNTRGIIVGYGKEEEMIRRKIAECELESTLTVVNGSAAKDIPERLAAADIYLSTSLQEGTSNSIMEALRAGIPVVATDVGDNRYLIQEGESGYIRPVRDVKALSDAVIKLSRDPALRERMGARARERMRTHHSIEHIVSQYKELIDG